ncbi:transmembrane protein, putative [Bodo saltans]|uniref:Transmembrane protein, putative n=1 Tax=Bodo saltans TaxID=75058 RepID=A0A0S4IZU1_BODSA|nr:transmembrane protein, putative [Bodo saltans]|eukprot:CUG69546.1 transmembrane protein, putative [Bodo saltans]
MTLTYDGGGCASAIGNIVMFTGGFTNVSVVLTNTSMTTYSVVGVPVPPKVILLLLTFGYVVMITSLVSFLPPNTTAASLYEQIDISIVNSSLAVAHTTAIPVSATYLAVSSSIAAFNAFSLMKDSYVRLENVSRRTFAAIRCRPSDVVSEYLIWRRS